METQPLLVALARQETQRCHRNKQPLFMEITWWETQGCLAEKQLISVALSRQETQRCLCNKTTDFHGTVLAENAVMSQYEPIHFLWHFPRKKHSDVSVKIQLLLVAVARQVTQRCHSNKQPLLMEITWLETQ